jgi:cytochrome P450
MFHDPDFMPFEPRRTPSLFATAHNFLENHPPAAYRGDFTSLNGLWPVIGKTRYLMKPELIEEMLVTRAEMFPRDPLTVNFLSGPINRDSLFFAEGADWKWQRRAVSSAFRHENILAQVPLFSACAQDLAGEWRGGGAAGPVDVMRAMSRTAFAVIIRSVLGAGSRFDQEKFLANLTVALEVSGWRRLIALFGLPAARTPHPGYFKARAALRHLLTETAKLIEERRATGSERSDILQLLLSAKDPETGRVMTDQELLGNLYTFLVAGHETSAVALGWSLWLLAKDQASQERLREEVRAVVGEAEITPETIERLVFTKQVLQESMRLFPPAPAVGRQPREDTTLGPYEVSKREPIYAFTWCLHRHEKLWDDPTGFDPDRFNPEQIRKRHRYAYLPFGAGPRICLGMSFAMVEMTTILATLVRDFRFETVPGHRMVLEPVFTVRPKGGLPLMVEPIRARIAQAAK